MKKKPLKAKSLHRIGILNGYGEFWTFKTFGSEEMAHKHIDEFWENINLGQDFKYQLVEVKINAVKLIT